MAGDLRAILIQKLRHLQAGDACVLQQVNLLVIQLRVADPRVGGQAPRPTLFKWTTDSNAGLASAAFETSLAAAPRQRRRCMRRS